MLEINNCPYKMCGSRSILHMDIRNPASVEVYVICPSCHLRGPSIPITDCFQYFDFDKMLIKHKEECDRAIRLWNRLKTEHKKGEK